MRCCFSLFSFVMILLRCAPPPTRTAPAAAFGQRNHARELRHLNTEAVNCVVLLGGEVPIFSSYCRKRSLQWVLDPVLTWVGARDPFYLRAFFSQNGGPVVGARKLLLVPSSTRTGVLPQNRCILYLLRSADQSPLPLPGPRVPLSGNSGF